MVRTTTAFVIVTKLSRRCNCSDVSCGSLIEVCRAGGHRLGCPLPVTTHSRWQLPAAPLCRRQLAVSVRAQQAATLEKLKTPAPTPSIAEGEDKSIWKTTYDISNVRTYRVLVSACACSFVCAATRLSNPSLLQQNS